MGLSAVAAEAGAWIGLINALAIFVLSSIRKHRLDYADVAPAGAVFIASYNVCPPVYLFWFVANAATRKTLPPELAGYEKFIGLAAVCSFLMTVVAVVTFYRKAWKRR